MNKSQTDIFIKAIQDLGLGPVEYPGVGEKMAMEIAEMVKSQDAIALALSDVADALREIASAISKDDDINM